MDSLAKRGGAPPAGARAGTSTHELLARRVVAAPPCSEAPRSSATGFSLVELLVTIVLAGIVFAALVPVFVSAQKASSGDRARNVATNVAQDRIEKIRLLSFDQIVDDASHLQSGTFAGGQFGTAFTPAGASKPYSVDYSVENVPSTGAVNYKRVSVTVSWTAPPAPVQPVTLTTIVMNPQATSASSSASPSPSTSPSTSPTPTPSPTSAATYALTILVTNNYVNASLGVTVVRTDVTPDVAATPAMQVPTTSVPSVWNLPAGTYLITCNYYKNGNSNNAKTLTQTVYITTSNQSYTFSL
jgi:prepilin-type N-terminal cleavage/methylation domain-containing protein